MKAQPQKPLVSIIVPVYNSEKYLSACLESIINQTYPHLEIILINDGSTDGSLKIINQFIKKDSRIKLIDQKNQGQSAARNQGLRLATGEFISFIDSDDYIKPSFIEKLLIPFQKDQTVSLTICGIHRRFLNNNHTENLYLSPITKKLKHESKKAYILRLLLKDGRLYSSVNKLYQAKIAKNIQFDTSLNFAEDTKFVLEYLKQSTGQVIFVNEPLYVYNFGSIESTINHSALKWENWENSFSYLKSWVGKNPSLKESLLLKLILLRWRISYYRSKKRASI